MNANDYESEANISETQDAIASAGQSRATRENIQAASRRPEWEIIVLFAIFVTVHGMSISIWASPRFPTSGPVDYLCWLSNGVEAGGTCILATWTGLAPHRRRVCFAGCWLGTISFSLIFFPELSFWHGPVYWFSNVFDLWLQDTACTLALLFPCLAFRAAKFRILQMDGFRGSRSRRPFQFTLKQLMALTLTVAILAGIFGSIQYKSFEIYGLAGWTLFPNYWPVLAPFYLVSLPLLLRDHSPFVRGCLLLAMIAYLGIMGAGFGINILLHGILPCAVGIVVSLSAIRICGYQILRMNRNTCVDTRSNKAG